MTVSNSLYSWKSVGLEEITSENSLMDTADWLRSDEDHTPILLENNGVYLPLGIRTHSIMHCIEGLAANTRSIAGPLGTGNAVLNKSDVPIAADLLDLRRFPADRVNMILPKCPAKVVRPDGNAYAVEFSDSWETFFLSRSKNFRQNLRTAENRLLREFGPHALRFREYELTNENWIEIFSLGKELSQKSWQGVAGVSVFFRQEKEIWLKKLRTEEFTLSLYFLMVFDETWATVLLIKKGGRFDALLYLMEFDQTRGFFSPGQLLVKYVLERCCTQGIQTVDFGIGGGAHKDAWCNRQYNLVRVLAPLTLIGHLAVWWQQLRWTAGRLKALTAGQ